MLIYINDKNVQSKILADFGFTAPVDSVIDTEDGKYNSPLWFEMFRPGEEVISNYTT